MGFFSAKQNINKKSVEEKQDFQIRLNEFEYV